MHLIHFDGALYHIIVLNENGEQSGAVESFPYLLHETSQKEFSWGTRDYNRYFLSSDETLTYNRIFIALVSSSAVDSELLPSFAFVCDEYADYVENAPQ